MVLDVGNYSCMFTTCCLFIFQDQKDESFSSSNTISKDMPPHPHRLIQEVYLRTVFPYERYNIGYVGQTASLSMFTLFESRYTLKGSYDIGNVGQTASMSMLTLFESRYTLKGRYEIGYVGKTASMSMLTLFESRYTLKGRYNIGYVGKTASMSMLTLFESRYTLTLTVPNPPI